MPYFSRHALWLGACLALALAPPDAAALWDDKLELFAVQAVTHDDNIFRLPTGTDARTLLGTPEIDDTRHTSALGVKLDVPMSRQRFEGELEMSRVRHERFSRLDFDGHSGRALWEWGLGDELKGKLGYSQRRDLASLATVQGGVQDSVPNVLTTRRAFAATEVLGASWRLQLEGSRLEQKNEANERRPNDLVLDSGEARLSYVSRAGNGIGLRGRLARGVLPNPQDVRGVPVDNSYRQREAGLIAVWSPGAHTGLRAFTGRVQRDYEERTERDFDGDIHQLVLNWTPTDKLALGALAQRDISATEEINVSFVLAERLQLTLRYLPSPRSEMSALLETSDRRFLGQAGQGTEFRERVDAVGLAGSYRPLRQVTLEVSLRRELRSTDFVGGDYEANIVRLGLRLGL